MSLRVPGPTRAPGAAMDPAQIRSMIPVLDPATLEVVGQVADQDGADAVRAVDVAVQATPGWAATAPRRRSEILRRAYDLMLRDKVELARLISRENGKSPRDAAGEVEYAAEFFRWFSEEAVRVDGHYGESPAGGTRTIVTRRPVGVAALVTPWNFPAAMATRKLAPALAAGCSVVLKPAIETPLTALAVVALLEEAGLPEGVVTVVNTSRPDVVVSTWLADSRVRKVSFTGSTSVGKLLLGQAAGRVLNASMELGGNAPFIVTADADLDAAAAGAMVAKFRNGGQACTAANRFYVHADVADDFASRFCAQVRELTVGAAADGCDIGPMISARAVADIDRAVRDATGAGARILLQGALPDLPGHFFPPTVLVAVPVEAELMTQETFGPVAPIATWTSEGELLALVNGSELGLAAYVFAGDLGYAIHLAERIDAGMVGINRGLVSDPSAPFGGVKESGLGREGGSDGIREFQETRYLSVAWPY